MNNNAAIITEMKKFLANNAMRTHVEEGEGTVEKYFFYVTEFNGALYFKISNTFFNFDVFYHFWLILGFQVSGGNRSSCIQRCYLNIKIQVSLACYILFENY